MTRSARTGSTTSGRCSLHLGSASRSRSNWPSASQVSSDHGAPSSTWAPTRRPTREEPGLTPADNSPSPHPAAAAFHKVCQELSRVEAPLLRHLRQDRVRLRRKSDVRAFSGIVLARSARSSNVLSRYRPLGPYRMRRSASAYGAIAAQVVRILNRRRERTRDSSTTPNAINQANNE